MLNVELGIRPYIFYLFTFKLSFSIRARSETGIFLENTIKVLGVLEAKVVGNLGDGFLRA